MTNTFDVFYTALFWFERTPAPIDACKRVHEATHAARCDFAAQLGRLLADLEEENTP